MGVVTECRLVFISAAAAALLYDGAKVYTPVGFLWSL